MNRKNIPLIFSACFLVVSTAVILVSFGNYFDISDEGLAAYLSLFGEQAVWSQQFQYITHAWGDFFGHSLSVYRLLYLVFVYLECFVFACAIFVYYKVPLARYKYTFFLTLFFCVTGAQSVFTLLTTPSYDSYAALAGFLWASMFLLVLSDSDSKVNNAGVLVLSSFSILIALMAKSTTGVVLLLGLIVLLPCFYYILNKKFINAAILWAYLGGMLGVVFWILVLGDNLDTVIATYSAYGSSEAYYLPKLLVKHVRDILAFAVYLGAYLIVWFIVFRSLKKSAADKLSATSLCFSFVPLILLLWFSSVNIRPFPDDFYQLKLFGFSVLKLFPSTIDNPKAKMITFLVSLSLAVLFWGNSFAKELCWSKRRDVVFFLVVIFTALGVFAGTTAFLSWHMRSVAGLVAAVPVVFYLSRFDSRELGTKMLGWALLSFAVLGVHHLYDNVLSHYYRCPPLELQVATSEFSPILKGVKIDSERAEMIDKIGAVLDQLEFNRSQDRMYVFPAAPGFLAALNVRAYGALWSTGALNDLDCYSFAAEKEYQDSKVYVLRGGDVPVEIKSCFLEKLHPGGDFKSTYLGDYLNYRQGIELHYYIDGPYVPY
ncbi:hypothetical protein [Maridesulfovibrio sp.]|uniref:hypothetical protein n=1 Tax=Maridesulfovibrio sp. TaxID=2795000 RepID=UPI0039EFF7C9